MKKEKIVFLDRDGVINVDKRYLHKIEDFEFTPKLFETCKHFQDLGYKLIVITNQSGIGRGYYTQDDFDKLTFWMKEEFRKNGINILDVFNCPHKPDENCACRKPNIGMIQKACAKYNIDLQSSWLIGDKLSDIQAARNANIPNYILVNNEYLTQEETKDIKYVVQNTYEAKEIII